VAYPDINFNVTTAVNSPGVVTYIFTVRNNASSESATAYDLTFGEGFAAYAPNAALVAGSVRATGTSTAARITSGNSSGDNAVGLTLATLNRGETLTVSFDVQRLPTAVPGSSTTSTATLTYDNVAGNSSSQQTSTATANTTLIIRPVPEVTQTVVATSANDTGTGQYVAANTDLKPGEIATVELVITVPEGDNTAFSVLDQLADAVAAGTGGRLAYVAGSAQVVSVGGNLSSLSGRSLTAPTVTAADSNNNGTQDRITLDFGGIRNTSDKAITAADRIVVRLQVQALDVVPNENGDLLSNTVTVNNTSAVTGASTNYASTASTVSFDLVEPQLSVAKAASVPAGAAVDAGTEITYTVTIQHAANSSANAYDIALADLLPAGLTLVAGSLASSAGTATSSGGAINLALGTYALGSDPITLTYRARVGDAAAPGQVFSSAATLNYDTQAGTGGRAEPAQTSTAAVSAGTFAPALAQTVVSTSLPESGTDRFTALPDVSVGETVTYRLTATLAEGTQRLVLTDTLPSGLQLVSAQVESVGANITGSSLRAGSAGTTSGSTLTFDFGTVVNAGDNVTDARDQVTVLVTARDVSAAAAGTVLTNSAVAQVYAPGATTVASQAAATQGVEVVRPEVAIAKTASATAGDAGDLVTYTVTLGQAAASSAAAYNLVVTDALAAGLTLVAGSARASAGTVTETAGGISYALGTLALGSAPVTITYQARVADSVANGGSLVSAAQLSYATAPSNGTTATGTASSAPFAVAITDTLDGTLAATSLAATSGSQVGPGELVTLRLVATLGEGAQRLSLGETLPAGLEYVSSRVVSLGNATGSALAAGAAGTFDGAAGRVNFNFGTLTNPGDNVSNAGDQVVVEVVARVAAGTAAGTVIAPAGQLTTATPTGTGTTTLSGGNVTLTVVSGTLGGKAFLDANGNGLQDSGEAGLAGAAVALLDSAGAATGRTATTDADGNYVFADLAPGSYITAFTAPGGRVLTRADQGTNDALDSDADPATGRTGVVNLAAGGSNRTIDAGFYAPATVGSTAGGTGSLVFADTNGNGVQDGGEAGLAGVAVRLLDTAGNVIATTTTGTGGTYSFAGVAPGTYQVEFVPPAGNRLTLQDQGTNEAVDSDAAPATGRTAAFTVASGGTVTNLGAGVYVPAAIGGPSDFVFTDGNANGIRDAGDAGLAGVTVRLIDAAGATVASTVTASDGTYGFSDLAPGRYYVEFVAPSGGVFSPRNQGTDASLNSDAFQGTGRTPLLTLNSGTVLGNIGAGLYQPVTVGGATSYVFADTNGNGVRDAGEAGVAGVTVRLIAADGSIASRAVTGSDGSYGLGNVAPGQYQVLFVKPAGTAFSPADRGGDDTADSDADTATGLSPAFTVTSGQGVTNISAGLYTPATVGGAGDVVFTDANGNGVRDAGEAGVAGATVRLLSAAGATVATTTTGTNGTYSFTGVAPGGYQVEFVPPAGTVFTLQDRGGNDAADSDAVPATGRTALFTLTSGGTVDNLAAGVFAPVTVGGAGSLVFTDTDGDGVQGGGEAGVTGVTVRLLDTAGNLVATTTTGPDGGYSFAGVAPGTYQVEFVPPSGNRFTLQDRGGNDATDSDADPATGRTAPFTVTSGGTVTNLAAGVYAPGTVMGAGDLVFLDGNGNGVRDNGEAGLSGATVRLLNAAGATVATTTTGAGGAYSFGSLAPGGYQVEFTAPAGTVFTGQDRGTNDAADSDANAVTGRTALFAVASGGMVDNVAAGVYAPAGITGPGNLVFTDANGNGVRDNGEAGPSGVTVRLLDAAGTAVATTTTGTGGAYAFAGVAPGTYQVEFVPPAGTVLTRPDQGGDDATDSDAAVATGRTAPFTVTSGQVVSNLAAGLYAPATIGGAGDVVFVDANGNGVRDAGEAGVAGATVRLLDAGGNPVASTTTGEGGTYSFAGLAPGAYQVEFVAPAGTVFTGRDRGGNDAADSDADPATGRSALITLASGGTIDNLAAGVFAPVSIGGASSVVFTDTNGNGVRDRGEGVVGGVTVRLLDAAGNAVATTTTGTNGAYGFAGVAPGTYQVEFAAPAGTAFTLQDGGTSEAADSDVVPATGRTALFTLASGGSLGDLSAGVYTPAAIGGATDLAFTDANANGVRDAGEAGLGNVTVRLLDAAGNVVATTVTGAEGTYAFGALAPGRYQLEFTAPTGYVFSPRGQGADDSADSDVSTANGRSPIITLVSGQTLGDIGAGLYQPVTVGGPGSVVFADGNGNGVLDAGEAGVGGVAVRLIRTDGTIAARTTTADDGSYAFGNVTPGGYQVLFVRPSGTAFSPRDQGGDDARDSDADTATGLGPLFTVASGQGVTGLSAGIYGPARITGPGNVVFTDANGNGVRDAGEAGVAGATVRLLDAAGNLVATARTGTGGTYGFADIAPGRYQVEFVAPAGTVFTRQDGGGDDATDSDAAPATGRTATFTVSSGGTVDNVAAGVFAPVTIGGAGSTLFTDANGNGVRDAGEAGVSGATVRLLDGNGTLVARAVTDANGGYGFTGVAPGAYQVEFVRPAGAVFTLQDQGGDDATDSDVGPSTGRTSLYTLASGGSVQNLSAGLYTPAAIGGAGNLFFNDANGNGVRDAGETGIAGATVRLLDASGNVVRSVATGSDGSYGFAGLTPGTYQLQFAAPAGAVFSARDGGGDDTADSDVDPATGRTDPITVTSGQVVGNLAAGAYLPATIAGSGNLAFLDGNGNGIRDAGESGLAGVTVRLLDASGAVVSTTTTGPGGAYSFTGLVPGGYQIGFVAPAGLGFSARDQGADDAADSDADASTGLAPAFSVGAGGVVNNVAAGFFGPGAIGGAGAVVFTDTNGNGIRDAGESGLGGVTVRLLDAAGATVATTVSGADGTYAFSGIRPGGYQVEFVAPAGSVFAPQDRGTDDTADSDASPATGRTPLFTLASGGTVGNLAAGFYDPSGARLTGSVWLDANENGLRDAGEEGLEGVAVRLLDADGQDLGRTTATDATGAYAFGGLEEGSYRVGYAPLIGTRFTAPDVGGNEALDSDAATLNGVSTLLVRLGQGEASGLSTAGLVLDVVRSPDYAPRLELGDGNDGFPGTDGPEVVSGNGGDDNINGLGGDDTFFGNAGRDAMNGLGGDDALSGGAGDDNVQGQEGDDLILGGEGNDTGEGGIGDDTLLAGAGDDNMQGEDGDDWLYGGGGADILTGNAGNDLVAGGAGTDSLAGADGSDIVIGGGDDGRMSLDANGVIAGIVLGDQIEGNGGADAFVWQAGDGVDFMLDFNPGEGDTLTIYGYTGFQAIQRTQDGRMALLLGTDAGFVLNNGLFQGATPADVLPGVIFRPALDGAPRRFVAGDVVVPVLAENWASGFRGTGPITVSQPFPPLDPPSDPADLSDIVFGNFIRLTADSSSGGVTGGNDFIQGESLYDTVDTSVSSGSVGYTLLPDGSLRLDAEGGTDLLRGVEQVNFTDGTLRVSTSDGPSRLTGGDGADTLLSGTAGDTLDGGLGDDLVLGGGGDDVLVGGAGQDTMDGGDGADTLDLSRATAAVAVDLGRTVPQAIGADQGLDLILNVENVTGGAFDDRLVGDDRANRLAGGGGNDVLSGAGGDDTLAGGAGNDTLDGGDGSDTIDLAAATGGVTVLLSRTTLQVLGADQGRDLILNVENAVGGAFADTLSGNASANRLLGGGGDDRLSGDLGDDLLDGGAGNDRLDGGGGADAMFGGAGNDAYVVDSAADTVREDAVAGTDDGGVDTVTAAVGFTLGAFLENLILTGGGSLSGTGNGLGNRLTGNDGANLLSGLDGNDVLVGGRGVDTLLGGAGNDTLLASDAGELLDGGDGVDTLDFSGIGSRGWLYLDGTDERGIARANAYAAAGSTVLGVENVTGSNTGNDATWGTDGANRLSGLGGSDRLYGKGGADTLLGGEGNDTLSGGAGADDLTGGAGADVFLFDTAPVAGTIDRVLDFEAGADRLAFSRAAFGIAAGVTPVFVTNASPAATGSGPAILYDNAGGGLGALLYDADGAGGAAAIQVTRLANGAAVAAGDLLFVA